MVAHRVIGGPGGVDEGSMVSFVRELLRLAEAGGKGDDTGNDGVGVGGGDIGVVLANTGQLLWWSEGDPQHGVAPRALTRQALAAIPMRSAVHDAPSGGDLLVIPGHHDARDHVRAMFEDVLPALAPSARAPIDVVAVGDAVDAVETYFDRPDTWRRWRDRLASFANVGGYHPVWELKCNDFKQFLREVSLCCNPLSLNITSHVSPHRMFLFSHFHAYLSTSTPRFPIFR